MDDYSRRREVLARITELLGKMPEDVLLQLIQHWEVELNEMLIINSKALRHDETESTLSE